MSKRAKVTLWKTMMGVAVLSLLFIGTFAITPGTLTSAKRLITEKVSFKAKSTTLPTTPTPLLPPGTDLITSVFELDGDITDNPAGAPDDWATLNCDGGNALVKTGVIHDQPNASIFTGGGSKDPQVLSGFKWKDGSVPDKDDILNAYAAKYNGTPGGDDILIFGADRYDNSGTAFIGFWFFKNSVGLNADGTFSGAHAVGDILVLSEFTQGGAIATSKVFEWVGTGGSESGGTLNDITATAPAGSVFSISNGTAQTIGGSCPAWVHVPKTGSTGTIQTNDYFEGGINLSAFPALQGACFSSFMAETRSSSVVTATLKDFVLGTFNTCVDVSISKTATDVCEGAATTYTYKVKNLGAVTANVTLTDNNETGSYSLPFSSAQIQADDIDVGADNNCATVIGAGSPTSFSLGAGVERTFVCTIAQSAGVHSNAAQATATAFSSSKTVLASATANVFVNPVAAAGADQSVCDTSPHQFTLNATAGSVVPTGGTVQWSGTGITFGSPTSLTTTATVSSFGTFTATLTIKSPSTQTPGCPDATDTVDLTLNQNPSASAGPDQSACENTNSHQFTINGTGTVPAGATIQWSGTGITFGSPNSLVTTATVNDWGKFTATLTVTNASTSAGCTNASDTVDLILNQNPVITIADVSCNAAAGGTSVNIVAQVTANGTAGTNSFVWKKNGQVISGQTTDTLNVTTPGTYTVEVTRSHTDGSVSCTNSKSKNVGLCAADAGP